jgi:hypothetical protein
MTGQINQGFPRFFPALEQILSWYRKSTLHCVLRMQPSTTLTSKFLASAQPSHRDQNFVIMLLSKPKTQAKCSAPVVHTSQHSTFFTAQPLTLFPAYLHQKAKFT